MGRGGSVNVRVGNAVLIAVALIAVTGCTGNLDTALERLSQARMLSSDLLVQFTKSAESSGRAAMAATEDASRDSARSTHPAEQATQARQLCPVTKQPDTSYRPGHSGKYLLEQEQRRAPQHLAIPAFR